MINAININIIQIIFLCKPKNIKVNLGKEHTAFKWANKKFLIENSKNTNKFAFGLYDIVKKFL